ncbi:hypothetical protein U9M48_012771 [Paspalum notatum var. saurae]|uniref:Uncharacterized protein n=1 Tax=Paspalum notatum var. saurae TaxID=547442 RepID=A0AAQ3T0D3_PASNO
MAPTLRDVSYPLGLPLRGDAMGPTDVGQGRREDLPARFGRVRRSGTAPPYGEFAPTHTGGPPKWWILQFKADDIGVGATEYEIARHLEAYVLWLMGRVMFCGSAGSFVPKHLLRFARSLDRVVRWSALDTPSSRVRGQDMPPAQPRRIATELPVRHPVHKE